MLIASESQAITMSMFATLVLNCKEATDAN